MKKYNLTFWQRIELIPLKIFWLLSDSDNKKSWHEVKKGIEKHECNFKIDYIQQGYRFLRCNHEGCYKCIFNDSRLL